MLARTGAQPGIRVWSPVVRLFHWALAISVASAWLVSEDIRWLHEYAGYAAVALVASRIVIGFTGSDRERFASFVAGTGATLAYLNDILHRRERRYIGHNPAGGAMIVALLAVIALLGATGWLMTTDAYWGDERLEAVHEFLADALVLLVGLHLCGVALASFSHGENLVRAMVTGRKRPPGPGDVA